jgi:hypothetical protein
LCLKIKNSLLEKIREFINFIQKFKLKRTK